LLNGTSNLDDKIFERLKNNQRLHFPRFHFLRKRFVIKLIDRVDQLIEFPESGREVPEKNNPEIRELIEGNYRIFYRFEKKRL
jgi:hypothetical protein